MKKIVKICGIPYEIIDKDFIESCSGRCVGLITYDEAKIEMRKGQHPDYYKQSLVHEVVHGMLVMIGRNDLTDDETFVQSLALAISQTFELKIENVGEEHQVDLP